MDERQSIGYTFKALGAGFYGLHKGTNFTETITKVIMEGGDADRWASIYWCNRQGVVNVPSNVPSTYQLIFRFCYIVQYK